MKKVSLSDAEKEISKFLEMILYFLMGISQQLLRRKMLYQQEAQC